MDFTHLLAGPDDEGRRLDKLLRRYLDDSSLSALYKSLRKGFIKVNGKKQEASYRICQGDDIQIASFMIASHRESEESGKSLDSNLILFRNQHFLILNKPYDMSVQDGGEGTSIARLVRDDYRLNHGNSSLSFTPAPLHRLDKKTTGILVCSQSLEGARYFSEKIQNHQATKIYLALVEGNLEKEEHWVDYLSEAELQDKKGFYTVTVCDSTRGKKAETFALPLAHGSYKGKDCSLVQFSITTGRHHQIRCQSSFHDFPLLGDSAYGASYGEKDLFLHAWKLSFPQDNQLGLPEHIESFISTKFEKMLESTLIKWDGRIKL